MGKGIDFFPVETTNSEELTMYIGEFGIKGFGFLVVLTQKILRDNNYFITYKEAVCANLLKVLGCSQAPTYIQGAIKYGLFDSSMFKKYEVLTNYKIQETFFKAYKRRTRNYQFNGRYVLASLLPELAKVTEFKEFLLENVNIKNREEREKILNIPSKSLLGITTREKSNTESTLNSKQKMRIFKAKYPEKVRNEAFEIPEKVDIQKLIEKIEASPWLQKNFYLEIMCQKYDDIIAGKYNPYENVSRMKKSDENKKNYPADNAGNFKERMTKISEILEGVEFEKR